MNLPKMEDSLTLVWCSDVKFSAICSSCYQQLPVEEAFYSEFYRRIRPNSAMADAAADLIHCGTDLDGRETPSFPLFNE